ncbi:MAG: glutamyl-tRNA reductase [Halodesulfurarchaeum sp.]
MNDVSALVVSHKRASVEQIRRLTERDTGHLLSRLSAAGAEEAFVLHTCNRAEYYVAGSNSAREAVLEDVELAADTIQRLSGPEAVGHLLRVAAGLESMVVGEDEILGQISRAREDAQSALGSTLDPVVEKAVRVGKRVRSETRINEGNPSMGTAAAELASRRLGDLAGRRAVVIGAGEMGKLVAAPLADRGMDLLVTNRTYDSARDLAERVDGSAICFEGIHSRLSDAELVVTATDAPHPVLDEATFDGQDITVLDLANPPDVPPAVGDLDSVTRFDIDDIGQIVDSAMSTRTEAAAEAESIVEEEMESLERDLKKREAEAMLSAIYEQAEQLRRSEVKRAADRLDRNGGLTEHEQAVLEDLGSALVNKLLSTPTQSIKEAAVSEDYETLRTVADVFEVSEAPETDGETEAAPESTEEQADS